jgi:D-erythrulose 1-phosphate 3-epimerase
MKPVLGINNCFAVKRWPMPAEWAQIVGDELGLGLVQHSLDLGLGGAPEIRAACERFGLRVDSVFTGLVAYSSGSMLSPSPAERASGAQLWDASIQLAAALGASSFGGHVGSLSRADADDQARRRERWSELDRRLDDLRAIAHAHGLDALLVENMACDREPSRIVELEGLIRDGEGDRAGVALCLDVGHQCVPGTTGPDADPYAWLRRMGRRTRVVHLQQSDAAGDHHWPFTAACNARGRIEAPRVLAALADSGAEDVSLILEVIPPFEADDRQVLEDLRESVGYWRDAIGE